MKIRTITTLLLLLIGISRFGTLSLQAAESAGVTSASDNLIAHPASDRAVLFNVSDTGVYKPILWGLDLAWLSEANVLRGIAFMGSDRVDLIRSSFTPTSPLVDGELATAELATLNERLDIIDLLGSQTKVVLNCDHPSIDAWFVGNASRWVQLIDITTKHHQDCGRTVVTVSPFNEPDYTTGQGTAADFYNIAGELRKNSRFDNIRISGGNTLNTDVALTWYNNLKDRLDEGNTHQLAGSFDNYASFYKTVKANGDHASNDELHNVMEAMVGVEYGMQTGIWWGTAELTRGEFVKASDGVRLGYAEHRPNWTAASVYKQLDGKVQGFVGSSERQAVTTSYRFVSKDRDVFYDGYGPQREFTVAMPGGTGYQTGQSNAERLVNITWGDDIQPAIDGRYILVNRNSGKVLEVAGGSTQAGANLRQNTNTGANYQQWNVTPVSPTIGGDFSYYTLSAVHSGKVADVLNWSLENGGSIDAWDDNKNSIQQWYLDYAGDGWFYLRSRYSAMCISVEKSSTIAGALVQQWEKNGGANQQWRLLPVGTPIEFVAPTAPANVTATPNAFSVRLEWTASPESDVTGYTVLRATAASGSYNTIARSVQTTAFIDNTVEPNLTYYYTIRAVDKALNRSALSNQALATPDGANSLVAHFPFNGNTLDSTVNRFNSAVGGSVTYTNGKVGANALVFNGSSAFLQLPPTLANHREITVATWVYWKGGSNGQRLFDFGNSLNEYLYLSPRVVLGGLRFAIKYNGVEQQLNATALSSGKWSHIALTLGTSGASLYVNGVQVATSNTITINPLHFKPVLNYIGRSQASYPLLNGYVDDFRVYNYVLSENEITQLAGVPSSVDKVSASAAITLYPIPAKEALTVSLSSTTNSDPTTLSVYNLGGSLLMSQQCHDLKATSLNVTLLPNGFYLLKITNRQTTLLKQFSVKH